MQSHFDAPFFAPAVYSVEGNFARTLRSQNWISQAERSRRTLCARLANILLSLESWADAVAPARDQVTARGRTMSQDDTTEGPDEIVAALQDCEHQVDQLKRENTLLRDASRTFGALAERLNASLLTERRQNADRRARPRGTRDRRQEETVGQSARR